MRRFLRSILPGLLILIGLLVFGSSHQAWSLSAEQKNEKALRQIDFANSLFLQKLYDMAATEYKKYVDEFPESASREVALFGWAESLYNLEDYQTALDVYQMQLDEFPGGEKRRLSLLRIGEISYRQEHHIEAENILTLLLAENPAPDIAEVAYYHLGTSYLAQNKFKEAQETFQIQIREFPEGIFAPFAKLSLGTTLVQVDDYGQAIQLWQEVIAQVGKSNQPRIRNIAIEAVYRLGKAYEDLKKYEEAATTFAQLTRDYPESSYLTSALYREAWAWFSAKKYDQAWGKAKALQDRPQLPDFNQFHVGIQYLLGLTRFENQAYDEAIREFGRVLVLPSDLPEWDVYQPQAQYQIVWCCFLKADYQKTQVEANLFWEQFPNHPLGGDVLFISGESYYQEEKYDQALVQYQSLVSKYPESQYLAEAFFKSGQCEMEMKDYEQAVEFFSDFQKRLPQNKLAAEASLMEGEAYMASQAYPQAVIAFQTYYRTYPDHPQIEYGLYKLALCFQRLGDYSKLAEVCQELLDRNPESPYQAMALFWTAYEWDRKDENRQAEIQFIELLRNFPQSPYSSEARLRLAMIYYRKDQPLEAARHFLVLIDSENPPGALDPNIYFWTAEQNINKKEYLRAIRVYSQLADRYPRNDIIEEASYRTAQCYASMQEWESAAEFYQRVLDDFPEGSFFEPASLGLGTANCHLKKYSLAVHQLETLTGSLDPAIAAQAGITLGEAYEHIGETDKAVSAYLKVAFLYEHPEMVPEAYWKAALLLDKRGDREQAKKHLQELQRLYPKSNYAKKAQKLEAADSPHSATK